MCLTMKVLVLTVAFLFTPPKTHSLDLNFSSEFDKAKQFYSDSAWKDCHTTATHAIDLFQIYTWNIIGCFNNCAVFSTTPKRNADSFISLYSTSIRHSSCISKCTQRIGRVQAVAWEAFILREPYDFIQMCLYKDGDLKKAAAAAVTLTVKNPNHSYMKRNIDNYKNVLNIAEEYFVDLEASPHEALFRDGKAACELENWHDCNGYMSLAWESYLQAYHNCSVLCEVGYHVLNDKDSNHYAVAAIADQVVEVVRCKAACRADLSKLNLLLIPDMDILMLTYLADSYHRLGDVLNSLKFVESVYFQSTPSDQIRLLRKALFEQYQEELAPDKIPDNLVPEGVLQYKSRLADLNELMRFISDEFVSQHEGESRAEKLQQFYYQGVQVIKSASDLGGRERFVADGFLSPDECDRLARLCRMHGIYGDGYQRKQPHTMHETFQGIDIPAVIQLLEDGYVAKDDLDLYLSASERAREFVQLYLNTHQLYFDYTHLVCREPLEENMTRDDLSHPVHADNCIIQGDGSCYRGAPAYTQRDYSGILYLSDDVEGGEFFFTDPHGHEQASIAPMCGRVIGFNAASYHGVKALTRGRRCAVAIWLTLDERYREVARENAYRILDQHRDSHNTHNEL